MVGSFVFVLNFKQLFPDRLRRRRSGGIRLEAGSRRRLPASEERDAAVGLVGIRNSDLVHDGNHSGEELVSNVAIPDQRQKML